MENCTGYNVTISVNFHLRQIKRLLFAIVEYALQFANFLSLLRL